MPDTRIIARSAAAGLFGLLLASCNAQDAPVAPSVDWPSRPAPTVTHVFGHVIDVESGAPVPAARIVAGETVTMSEAGGEYTIGNLRQSAITLVATKAGYDTTFSLIPLEGGDKEFTLRMHPLGAAAH